MILQCCHVCHFRMDRPENVPTEVNIATHESFSLCTKGKTSSKSVKLHLEKCGKVNKHRCSVSRVPASPIGVEPYRIGAKETDLQIFTIG